MKQFLVTLPRNLIGCFTGRRIIWHIVAIVFTAILVRSGFDWRYFLVTRNPTLRSWMWPAVVIGMLLPLYLPLLVLAIGFIARNAKVVLTGWAIGQAELIGCVGRCRLQSVYRPRSSAVQRRRGHQSRLPIRFSARRSFLGLAVVAHHHRVRHGCDGLHALAKATVAWVSGNSLRVLHRYWCFHDHPLVLGFRGWGDHRLGRRDHGREELWAKHSTLNSDKSRAGIQHPTSEVMPERGDY